MFNHVRYKYASAYEALGCQEVAKKMPPTIKTQIKAEKEIIAAFTDN